jgi:hypothetical protein
MRVHETDTQQIHLITACADTKENVLLLKNAVCQKLTFANAQLS